MKFNFITLQHKEDLEVEEKEDEEDEEEALAKGGSSVMMKLQTINLGSGKRGGKKYSCVTPDSERKF